MNEISKLKEFLKLPRKIAIITHIRPDGDAVGSTLALYHFFVATGHMPSVIFPSEIPYFYDWFPGADQIIDFQKKKNLAKSKVLESEIIFVVDLNQVKRMNDLGQVVSEHPVPKVLIDHHPFPEEGFDYYFYDSAVASAGEKVYDFIEFIHADLLRDKTIATCLYAAIASDTGSFKFAAVSSNTMRIAASLMDTGINHTDIQRKLFDNFTESRLRMWGYCISEKMEILNELKTAIITLTSEDLKKFTSKLADTENLVNMVLNIEEVSVGILVVELPDMIKLSFRSKGKFPVNELASKYFNGGGHMNAAGGQTNLTLQQTVDLLKEKLREFRSYLE